MTWDYYLESQKIIMKYFTKFTHAGLTERATARRQLYSEDEKAFNNKFKDAIMETANFESMCRLNCCQIFYEHVSVPKEVFDKSQQVYSMDQTKR